MRGQWPSNWVPGREAPGRMGRARRGRGGRTARDRRGGCGAVVVLRLGGGGSAAFAEGLKVEKELPRGGGWLGRPLRPRACYCVPSVAVHAWAMGGRPGGNAAGCIAHTRGATRKLGPRAGPLRPRHRPGGVHQPPHPQGSLPPRAGAPPLSPSSLHSSLSPGPHSVDTAWWVRDSALKQLAAGHVRLRVVGHL
jgi:hypothetical protein